MGDVKHVYFPDFFIKSENKIIEVKSQWTIKLRRGNVEEKAQATIAAGYKYEIWIYNDKRVKVEIKSYWNAGLNCFKLSLRVNSDFSEKITFQKIIFSGMVITTWLEEGWCN